MVKPTPEESDSIEAVVPTTREAPTIVLVAWPQPGHSYPFVQIARGLRAQGARPIFWGFERGRELVERQGFEFHEVANENEVMAKFGSRNAKETYAYLDRLSDSLAELLRTLKATNVIIDPLMHYAAIASLRAGVPAHYVWVFNPPILRAAHLPFTASWRMRRSWWFRRFPRLPWLVPLMVYHLGLRKWRFRRTITYTLLKQTARSFRKETVFGMFGLMIDLPGYVMGPKLFSDCEDDTLTYLGLSIDSSRTQSAITLPADKPVVLGSFGSNFGEYPCAPRAMRHLVKAAGESPQFHFYIQAPDSIANELSPAANVTILRQAPTLQILKQAAFAITHGGYGGIKECIYFGVPPLVVPFKFDQPGNAVKVAEQNIGVVVPGTGTTPSALREAMLKLANDGGYRSRIRLLRDRMLADDRYDEYWRSMGKTRNG